jgi:hypothetical protein
MLHCTLIRWMMVSGNVDAVLHLLPMAATTRQNECCASSDPGCCHIYFQIAVVDFHAVMTGN